jgi:hypothetical protein
MMDRGCLKLGMLKTMAEWFWTWVARYVNKMTWCPEDRLRGQDHRAISADLPVRLPVADRVGLAGWQKKFAVKTAQYHGVVTIVAAP